MTTTATATDPRPGPAPAPLDLSASAMLLSVSIRFWEGYRHDPTVSREVATNHSASASAGRYSKHLFSREIIGDLASAARKVRETYYHFTLPWLDDGARILSAGAYLDAMRELAAAEEAFNEAREAFLDGYPDRHQAAARQRLGTMFDPAEWPPLPVARRRFGVERRIFPLPSGDDFRVHLSADEREAIAQQVEHSVREASQAAMGDAWRRLTEALGRVSGRMQAYADWEARGHTGRQPAIYDSVLGDLRAVVSLLPAFNLTNDPAMTRVHRHLEATLCRLRTDHLRTSGEAREIAHKTADDVLEALSGYLGPSPT